MIELRIFDYGTTAFFDDISLDHALRLLDQHEHWQISFVPSYQARSLDFDR